MMENIQVVFSSETPQPKKERQVFELQVRDIVFAILFGIVGIMFSAWAIWGGFQLGATITMIAAFLIFSVYLYKKGSKITWYTMGCGLLAVICSLSFTITSNDSVRTFSFFVTVMLAMVWFHGLVDVHPQKSDLGILNMLGLTAKKGLLNNFTKSLYSLIRAQGKYRKLLMGILAGFVAAMPVLFVVVPLMASSDAAFAGMMEDMGEKLGELIQKLVLGLVFTPFLISYGYTLKKEHAPEMPVSKFQGLDHVVIISFLSTVSVSYVAYLVSQMAYFFSAFAGFLPEDYEFTMAGYARRGFFEMTIIVAINLVLIFLALIFSKKNEGKLCIASRVVCTFISVFTIMIIATAFSKMYMYIDNFGLTRLRLLTSAFMVFLTVVMLVLIVRLYMVKIQVLNVALVTAGVILAVLGIGNVNHVVANYNYNAYRQGIIKDIDVETIYELREEGIPYLIQLAEDDNEEVAKDAKYYLYHAILGVYVYEFEVNQGKKTYTLTEHKAFNNWEEYSVAGHQAYEWLDAYIEQHPRFAADIEHVDANAVFYLELE